jgi:hypothetical protein
MAKRRAANGPPSLDLFRPTIFTPEIVFEMLRASIIDETAPDPHKNDPGIANLAMNLECVEIHVRYRRKMILREDEQYHKVRDAIDILLNILPDVLETENELKLRQKDNLFISRSENKISMVKALHDAAAVVRENRIFAVHIGLMHGKTAEGKLIAPQPAEEWKDIAPHVMELFFEFISGHSKETAYRFIARAIPKLTGESITDSTVKDAFKKKTFVKRGRQ